MKGRSSRRIYFGPIKGHDLGLFLHMEVSHTPTIGNNSFRYVLGHGWGGNLMISQIGMSESGVQSEILRCQGVFLHPAVWYIINQWTSLTEELVILIKDRGVS